jgi:hypothetical protein
MSLLAAKQIRKTLAAPIRLSGVSVTGDSATITSQVTTALSSAGDGGVSVPLQVSVSNGLGVVATAPSNRCEIYDATSKGKIVSATNEEVYGRVTEAGGVYTLSFFTLESGTETDYSFPSAADIDVEFNYRFDFARLPTDALIAIGTRNISQDPATAIGQKTFREQLTVTATNAVSDLTKTPVNATAIELIVNGQEVDSFGGSNAAFTVNLSTKAVSWSATNAGFNLDTTDRVIAVYSTIE